MKTRLVFLVLYHNEGKSIKNPPTPEGAKMQNNPAIEYFATVFCPHCRSEIYKGFMKVEANKNCPACGKALKYEDCLKERPSSQTRSA